MHFFLRKYYNFKLINILIVIYFDTYIMNKLIIYIYKILIQLWDNFEKYAVVIFFCTTWNCNPVCYIKFIAKNWVIITRLTIICTLDWLKPLAISTLDWYVHGDTKHSLTFSLFCVLLDYILIIVSQLLSRAQFFSRLSWDYEFSISLNSDRFFDIENDYG